MKFSEVFTALQTGVMDGQENPFTQIYSAKFQEVQKYLSLTGHVYTPAYLTVGATKWASAAGRRAQDRSKTRPRRRRPSSTRRRRRTTTSCSASSRPAGMQVNDADKDAFIAASKPIYEEFAQGSDRREGADRPRHRARQVGAGACMRGTASAPPRLRAERFRDATAAARVGRHRADGGARRRGHARRGVPLASARSLVWYDEIASILLAWLTFYGSALAVGASARTSAARRSSTMLPPGASRRVLRIVAAAAGDRVLRAARLGRRTRSCRCSPATRWSACRRCR